MSIFVPMSVTIDGVDSFNALVNLHENWNGFLVPIFDADNAELVMEWIRDAWTHNGGAIVTRDENCVTVVSEEGTEIFDSVTVLDKTYFAIGAGSYSWERA